jgi:multidrug efflux pump subunit AcrA (membrane-fusion protein)
VTVVRVDPLRLRVEIPEREALPVRLGQKVRVFIERDTNAYGGTITRLSPAITQQSRVLVAEADVPSEGRLRPGAFARAEIITISESPSLVIPPAALVSFAGVEKVFAVESGKALETTVITGDRGPKWIEIVSGLQEGDLVVVNPGGLQTGQAVITGTAESNHAETR